MELAERRIIVMRPGEVGAAAVVQSGGTPHEKPDVVSGHDVLVYVARGHGTYRNGRQSGPLLPNMLLAAAAGSFECDFDGFDGDDHELYFLAFRDVLSDPEDARSFTPSFERLLTPREGDAWRERIGHSAWLIEHGRFDVANVRELKKALAPMVWRKDRDVTRITLGAVLDQVWNRIDEPLSLDGLARHVGYSANYLNDLARAHTGRPVGRWITDMRMSRARQYLEQTDVPIADVGAACGYDDPAYFSRVFRREHSVPPATWRIAARPHDARYSQVALPIEEMHARMARDLEAPRAYSIAS